MTREAGGGRREAGKRESYSFRSRFVVTCCIDEICVVRIPFSVFGVAECDSLCKVGCGGGTLETAQLMKAFVVDRFAMLTQA
jgi:hypothetical protein